MKKAIIRYILLLFCDIGMTILNFFLAPFLVLLAEEDEDGNHWLPSWLSWFQTPKNPLEGDNGWKENHVPYPDAAGGWQQWWNFTLWLWRNSCYGFAINVLGCTVQEGFKFEIEGSDEVSNRPLVEGLVVRKMTNPDGNVYFQWYYVKAWPTWLSESRCIRINLGWKLWGNLDIGEEIQYVFSPNPAMGYSTEE